MKLLNSILRGACVGAVALGLSGVAAAQDKYMGEVFLTAATYCPSGTFEARGQLMPIMNNQALFALLGTTYGGNGQTTFALPDLQGRVPVGIGQGPGLSNILLGQTTGTENATLFITNMPQHNHILQGGAGGPVSVRTAQPGDVDPTTGDDVPTAMVAGANGAAQVGIAGGSQPFPIRDPSLGMRYCIVSEGLWPPRD